jgi:hypothetical protein
MRVVSKDALENNSYSFTSLMNNIRSADITAYGPIATLRFYPLELVHKAKIFPAEAIRYDILCISIANLKSVVPVNFCTAKSFGQ